MDEANYGIRAYLTERWRFEGTTCERITSPTSMVYVGESLLLGGDTC